MGNSNANDCGELIARLYPSLLAMAHSRRFRSKWCSPSSLAQETVCRVLKLSEIPKSEDQLKGVSIRYMEWAMLDRMRSEIARKTRELHSQRDNRSELGSTEISNQQLVEGLRQLAELSPRKSEALTLWLTGGMTLERIAQVLNVNVRTVRRDIDFACAWLATQSAFADG
ncbi:MAG: sigma-70 family RNA polymerase sigma factor [Phycisphaerales bacterium]